MLRCLPELSIAAWTILTAIATNVDADGALLLDLVPWNEPALGTSDVGDWFDALQEVLNAQLALRVTLGDRYVYRATPDGRVFVDAYTLRALGLPA